MDSADGRARRFAESNTILNQPITAGEVQDVQIVPDSQKVRVVVRRQQVGTWFAKLLGVNSVPIGARAAAVAVAAGAAELRRPLAIPDMWIEATEDPNGNRLEDDGENWSYTGDGSPVRAGRPQRARGWHRLWQQHARQLRRRPVQERPRPARYRAAARPDEPDPVTRARGSSCRSRPPRIRPTPPRTGAGWRVATATRWISAPPYPFDESDPQVPANTAEVLDSLINDDNLAQWDDQTGSVRGSRFADWRNSPRVDQGRPVRPAAARAGTDAGTLEQHRA